MKLNQLIAIIETVKNNTLKKTTEVYHTIQKTDLFKGISRTYKPEDDNGYVYPPESRAVQKKADQLIEEFVESVTELINLCATQDWANTEAKADVVVDGTIVLSDVPVTFLIFLEKYLVNDIRAFIQQLPVLDADKTWEYDANRGVYVTEVRGTTKTKKITKPLTLYEATKEHPAQVKEVSEDIVEGTWSTIDLSGALPKQRVDELLTRVNKLIKAVIAARVEANSMTIEQRNVTEALFGYLFS